MHLLCQRESHGYCDSGDVEIRKYTYSYIYTLRKFCDVHGCNKLLHSLLQKLSISQLQRLLWRPFGSLSCVIGLAFQSKYSVITKAPYIWQRTLFTMWGRNSFIFAITSLERWRELCNPTSKDWYHRESGRLFNKCLSKTLSPTLLWASRSYPIE